MIGNQITDNAFWDIGDLSLYLKVKKKTLYAMINEIPHYRLGKMIRFKKEEIDEWLKGRKLTISGCKESINLMISQADKGKDEICNIIRKAIDQSKNEVYNPGYGKSDRIKGPTKEINYGSI